MKLKTRLRSTAMRFMASEARLNTNRRIARVRRLFLREPPCVHYFHQADDPAALLTVKYLDRLKTAYTLPFVVHLTSAPAPAFQGDASLYSAWRSSDSALLAPLYESGLTAQQPQLDADNVAHTNSQLTACIDSDEFAATAVTLAELLWAGNTIAPGVEPADSALRTGDTIREQLGHYQSASFYFDGEWFTGVDRIHLLEQRLINEGYANNPDAPLAVPLATGESAKGANASGITLEYFPSLRSPYTAVGHKRVMDMVSRSGVTLLMKPVMPMMMRGIPAPFAKQQYIMIDAAREARYHQVPFGRFVDPFGEPVKFAFSIYTRLAELGHGNDFVNEYLSAAWAEGIDITTHSGLAVLLNRLSVDISVLADPDPNWQSVLDANLADMNQAGLWGVPSFRVSGGSDEAFSCWGQDRIWRVETEIARRANGQ